jgi:hypothetical protein
MKESVQSHNEYVLDLYCSSDIRNVSKLKRTAWVAYAARMVEMGALGLSFMTVELDRICEVKNIIYRRLK